MNFKRILNTLRLWTIPSDSARAKWAKKHNIYAGIGENVRIMDRKIPLYSKLIKFHNNIQVASNVSFITHDAIYSVFRKHDKENEYQEWIGCIEVMDNVFIGSGSIILGNTRIGPNAIVAAGSFVNKDVPPNSVVGGVPAKVIGSYSDLMEKRRKEIYPPPLTPKCLDISEMLRLFMWSKFSEERKI